MIFFIEHYLYRNHLKDTVIKDTVVSGGIRDSALCPLSKDKVNTVRTRTIRYKKTHKHNNGGLIVTDKFRLQTISIKSGSGGWI